MSVLPNNWQLLFIYKIPESSCYYTAPIIDSYSKNERLYQWFFKRQDCSSHFLSNTLHWLSVSIRVRYRILRYGILSVASKTGQCLAPACLSDLITHWTLWPFWFLESQTPSDLRTFPCAICWEAQTRRSFITWERTYRLCLLNSRDAGEKEQK